MRNIEHFEHMKEHTAAATGEGNAPRRMSLASFNGDWRPISSDMAWKLCESVGKAAPYAGYMVEAGDKLIRCLRTDRGTCFEQKEVALHAKLAEAEAERDRLCEQNQSFSADSIL